MTVIIFILVLLVTVLVHEWGHFFVAKRSKMQVDEFGFGIPPRLFSWKKGKTTYSLNALPIGGFVKIAGENPDEVRTDVPNGARFTDRPKYQQALVLVAGVVCNFLLGWLLLSASYTLGVPHVAQSGVPEVITLSANGPAQNAGVTLGDTVTKAQIELQIATSPDTETLIKMLAAHPGKPLTLTVVHKGVTKDINITPKKEGNTSVVGISVEPLEMVKVSFFMALWLGMQEAASIATEVARSLGVLVVSLVHGTGGLNQFIGPVGLASAVGEAAHVGFSYFLSFIALISINLAILNLLPFPALDGGRLVILGLETITRKKFNQQVVGVIHLVGFGLLILLMIFLTYKDILRLHH